MKGILSWDVCEKDYVKRVDPDMEKIESIEKMCKTRQRLLERAELDEETASLIATDYYEIMKELLVALLLKNGLKSQNHECLVSFFKHRFPEYEYEALAIHQLKEVRNRVCYDGIFVKKDYIERNILEFNGIIKTLYELLEK